MTIPFELQEMLAFIDGAEAALDDLEPELDERDPEAAASVEADLERLRTIANDASEGGESSPLEEVEALEGEAGARSMRSSLRSGSSRRDEADFDLVDISLDQMEAAVSAGEYEQAEQARLSAYALLRVRPRDQAAAPSTRSWSPRSRAWSGTARAAVDGLGELIASGAVCARSARPGSSSTRPWTRRGRRPATAPATRR